MIIKHCWLLWLNVVRGKLFLKKIDKFMFEMVLADKGSIFLKKLKAQKVLKICFYACWTCFLMKKKFKKFHHHGHLWWPLEVTSDAGWSKLKNGPEVSLKGSSVQNFNNFLRTVFSQSIFKETLFWTLKRALYRSPYMEFSICQRYYSTNSPY